MADAELKNNCPSCDSLVADEVYHCKQCNRCVKDLDHHCRWVNNCINKRTYRLFLNLLKLLSAYGLLSAAVIIVDIGQFYSERSTKQQQQPEKTIPLSSTQIANLVCEITVALLHLIMCALVAKLYLFHMWLMKHNMTTLEYYLKYKEKAKEPPRTGTNARVVPMSSDIPRRKLKPIDTAHRDRVIDDDPRTSAHQSRNLIDNQVGFTPRSSIKSDGSGGSTPANKDTERAPISHPAQDSTARLLAASSGPRTGVQRVIITNLNTAARFPGGQIGASPQQGQGGLQKKNLSLIQKPVKRLRSNSQEAEKHIQPAVNTTTKAPKQLPPLVLSGVYKKSLKTAEKPSLDNNTSSGLNYAKRPKELSQQSISKDSVSPGQNEFSTPETSLKQKVDSQDMEFEGSNLNQQPEPKTDSGATSVSHLAHNQSRSRFSISASSKQAPPNT